MTAYGSALNTDSNGINTSARYGDPGDGTSRWFHDQRMVDGAHVSFGLKADAAVVDPASSATAIALLKGILTEQLLIATSTAAAVTGIDALVGENTVANTTALAASLVVKASAGTLKGIVGYSTTAQFIQVHNTTSLPADTAVPLVVIPIVANSPYSIDFGDGLPCSTGITVSNSTTGPTKTIGGADTWITATYI